MTTDNCDVTSTYLYFLGCSTYVWAVPPALNRTYALVCAQAADECIMNNFLESSRDIARLNALLPSCKSVP